MKISCQACGTKYTIADDKIRGRKVRVRCKSCSTPIVVDTAQAEADAQAEAAAAASGGSPDAGAAPDAGDPWTVNLSDTEQRTMTTEEIVTGYHSGTVTDDAFAWKEGMDDWVPLLEVPELRAAIEAYGTRTRGAAGPRTTDGCGSSGVSSSARGTITVRGPAAVDRPRGSRPCRCRGSGRFGPIGRRSIARCRRSVRQRRVGRQ